MLLRSLKVKKKKSNKKLNIKTMKLKILSFSGGGFTSESVESVTLMTGGWELTILEDHAPLLASMKPSTMYIIYTDENGVEKRDDFAVWSGVIEVSHDSVKVMSDMFVDIEDLDKDRAEREKFEAEKLMEKYKTSDNRVDMDKFIEAEDMLLKSIAQLKLSDKDRR